MYNYAKRKERVGGEGGERGKGFLCNIFSLSLKLQTKGKALPLMKLGFPLVYSNYKLEENPLHRPHR